MASAKEELHHKGFRTLINTQSRAYTSIKSSYCMEPRTCLRNSSHRETDYIPRWRSSLVSKKFIIHLKDPALLNDPSILKKVSNTFGPRSEIRRSTETLSLTNSSSKGL